jgi:hypothetical protein
MMEAMMNLIVARITGESVVSTILAATKLSPHMMATLTAATVP